MKRITWQLYWPFFLPFYDKVWEEDHGCYFNVAGFWPFQFTWYSN